jgi:pyruvate carboxylase
MFTKILVANRGEIAIRAFRAAVELGAKTVAVYPFEDRNSLHRLKADEAYQIGEPGHPVRAYLDVSEIIRVAKESGADAIYPGYGFLSENPELARAAAEAGITFIGPPKHVLEMAGNKVTAKEYAIAAGVPVLKSTPPSRDVETLVSQADEVGFPIFAKAVAGGGGRGMRRVNSKDELRPALEEAMREADSAFGDPTMFLEQAVLRPRHIEVQVLADASGETVHLFERDCSVQRRHQKVIEIAPAPNLSDDVRQSLYRDAIAFAKSIGYVNAGTVEFLLDTAGERAGQHVFIEMNPRIQVEHTVTEEVTDVDLVVSQMRIAAGESLAELGLLQDAIRLRGAALQCRITTEDPTAGFRPDTGKITTYRSPGGAGIRLDGGTINPGAQISPHFDSMLAKLTCRGRDYPAAVARQARPRGVPHPGRLDEHPIPPGGARRRLVRRRRPQHLVHRRASAAAPRAGLEGPRHEDPQLARGCHGEPAERRGAHEREPRREAAPDRHHGSCSGRIPAAAPRARPGRLRPGTSRADAARGHRDHVPRCPPVAPRDPRAHEGPRRRRTVRRADDP